MYLFYNSYNFGSLVFDYYFVLHLIYFGYAYQATVLYYNNAYIIRL